MSGTSLASFTGLSHHSRANCSNNESITWDWTQSHWSWVNSDHYNQRTGALVHLMFSNWYYSWRNAEVHWGEGRGGWLVKGDHWMHDAKNNPVRVADEVVTDCSIYDGWWEKDK